MGRRAAGAGTRNSHESAFRVSVAHADVVVAAASHCSIPRLARVDAGTLVRPDVARVTMLGEPRFARQRPVALRQHLTGAAPHVGSRRGGRRGGGRRRRRLRLGLAAALGLRRGLVVVLRRGALRRRRAGLGLGGRFLRFRLRLRLGRRLGLGRLFLRLELEVVGGPRVRVLEDVVGLVDALRRLQAGGAALVPGGESSSAYLASSSEWSWRPRHQGAGTRRSASWRARSYGSCIALPLSPRATSWTTVSVDRFRTCGSAWARVARGAFLGTDGPVGTAFVRIWAL